MIPFVLASGSPRRRALLAALGLEFEVRVSDAPEIDEGAEPDTLVLANARAKCDAVTHVLDHAAIVIAADTLVFVDGHVLSKPVDRDDACAMLRRLSGRTHEVRSGLALSNTASGLRAEGVETTRVTFRALSEAQIDRFVNAVNPLDRAGAYTVDGPGSLLVARYEGCYQNVLGLPIVKLDALLREIGVDLFERMEPARARFL